MKERGNWYAGFETVSNFRMYYRDWRPTKEGAGVPVVALHGSLTQGGMWCATAEGTGRYRFVCPDQRGFGLSADPGKDDSAADFARDVIELVNVLRIDRFAVMGHSFAGAIALRVAAAEPDRVAAVVLVDPTVSTRKANRENLSAAQSRPESFASLKEAEDFFRKTEEGAWPGIPLKRFVRDVMIREENGGPCRMPVQKERLIRLRNFQASEQNDFLPFRLTEKVKCPVSIFRGGQSSRFAEGDARRLARAFRKGASLVNCAKSGHFPTVSETDRVARELRKFLGGVT